MYGPVHARMAEAESDLHSAPFSARAGGQCFAGRVWKFQACSLNFLSVLGAKRTILCVKKAKNICVLKICLEISVFSLVSKLV
jgi:hypothetical protein